MDRDEAAMLLVVLVSGALIWFAGALTPSRSTEDERAAWRHLWLPAIPASIPVFALLGFAIADPEGPQSLHLTRLVAIVPFGVVWLRAAVRATRTLFTERGRGPALTRGFFRPHIVISDELRDSLHEGELRAVMAHEEAHVRHRDPLRIWLVQLLTDLQWPLLRPRLRQRTWLGALEIARDEEAARQPNVDAADLASAIVKAARLVPTEAMAAAVAVALTHDEALLETRVRRLLDQEAKQPPKRGSVFVLLGVCAAIAAFVFGVMASAPFVALVAGSP